MLLPLYIADRKRRVATHTPYPGWVISGRLWVEPTVAAAELGRDPVELFDQVQDEVAGFLQRYARYVERVAGALFFKHEWADMSHYLPHEYAARHFRSG